VTTRIRTSASRKALLDAFESLLARQGAGRVGVNAVLEEAGVGKQLLYRYFGDLEGLAAAWSQERRDPLDLGSRRERLVRELRRLPRSRRIGEIVVDYASMLREHPWVVQAMLAELSHADSIGKSMRDIRRETGVTHESLLLDAYTLNNDSAVARAFILHAAAAYLAMRARLAPDYNGIDLASESGWSAAMDMLRRASVSRAKGARRTRSRMRRSVVRRSVRSNRGDLPKRR